MPNAHVSTEMSTHSVATYLKNYTLIEKSLQVLTERNFITESLFTQGYNAEGGGITYHRSLGKYMDEDQNNDDDFEIQEGSEFHQVYMTDVGPQIEKVKKFGIETWITFEDVRRNQLGVLARATTRMMNTMVKHFDRRTMSMLRTHASIRNYTAGSDWDLTTASTVYDDILVAKAMVADEVAAGGTYEADTLVVSSNIYAKLVRNTSLKDLLKDRPENPYFRGTMESLAGLNIMKTPHMPDSVAFVLAKGEIGGIADEEGLQMKPPEKNEAKEVWYLRCKRLTVPFLTDPGAIVRIAI